MHYIDLLFESNYYRKLVQRILPTLFKIAEMKHRSGGKLNMSVGVERERALIALFIICYGRDNVDHSLPPTQKNYDMLIKKNKISIKTSIKLLSFKLIWTADQKKIQEFIANYTPSSDIIFTHIKWGGTGGLYFFPKQVQKSVYSTSKKYLNPPKSATNSRGISIWSSAVKNLINHKDTKSIPIKWLAKDIDFDPIDEWISLWKR